MIILFVLMSLKPAPTRICSLLTFRTATPSVRERVEFQVELWRNLEIRVRGLFYVQTLSPVGWVKPNNNYSSFFI